MSFRPGLPQFPVCLFHVVFVSCLLLSTPGQGAEPGLPDREEVHRVIEEVLVATQTSPAAMRMAALDRLVQLKWDEGRTTFAMAIANEAILYRLDQAKEYARYADYPKLVEFVRSLNPYGAAIKYKSPELMAAAILAFKGYAIDSELNEARKWSMIPAEKKEIVRKWIELNEILFGQHVDWDENTRKKARIDLDRIGSNAGEEVHSLYQYALKGTDNGLIPSLQELQALIGEDEAMFDIVQVARPGETENYYACAITKNQVKGPILIGKSSEIDELIRRFYRQWRSSKGDGNLVDLAADLRHKITGGFEAEMQGKRRLLFSVDGSMNFIPIHVLPDAKGRLLLQEHDVGYCDSFRQYIRMSSRRSSGKTRSVILVGNPMFHRASSDGSSMKTRNIFASLDETRLQGTLALPRLPGAETEVSVIRNILEKSGTRVSCFLGSSANEEGRSERTRQRFFQPDRRGCAGMC